MKTKSRLLSGFSNPRIAFAAVLCSAGICLIIFSLATPAAATRSVGDPLRPVVIYSVYNAVSPKISDLPLVKNVPNGTWEVHKPLPIHAAQPPPQLPVIDAAQQKTAPALAMPAPLQTFEGMNQADGCGNCIPPD